MKENHFNIVGLTNEQVILARKQFGRNSFDIKDGNAFLGALKRIMLEPMMILLLAASSIYFIR